MLPASFPLPVGLPMPCVGILLLPAPDGALALWCLLGRHLCAFYFHFGVFGVWKFWPMQLGEASFLPFLLVFYFSLFFHEPV